MRRSPIVPGHEMIGTVVAVAAGEKKWKVGDRVGGSWHGGHDGIHLRPRKSSYLDSSRPQVSAKPAIAGCSRCAKTLPSMASSETVVVRRPPKYVIPLDELC